MKLSREFSISAIAGVAATIGALALNGGVTGDPPDRSPEVIQQQIDDCADSLPVAMPPEGIIGELTAACERYPYSFTRTDTGQYYLMTGDTFRTLAEEDELNSTLSYPARVVGTSILGGVVMAGIFYGLKELQKPPKQPEPTPGQTPTTKPDKSKLPKRREDQSEQFPLDDLSDEELHELALRTSSTYRRLKGSQ